MTNASNDRLQPIARPSGTPTIDRRGEAQQHELDAVQHMLVQPRVGVAGHGDLPQRIPDSAGAGKRPGPIVCVSVVSAYHDARRSATNVATPTADPA